MPGWGVWTRAQRQWGETEGFRFGKWCDKRGILKILISIQIRILYTLISNLLEGKKTWSTEISKCDIHMTATADTASRPNRLSEWAFQGTEMLSPTSTAKRWILSPWSCKLRGLESQKHLFLPSTVISQTVGSTDALTRIQSTRRLDWKHRAPTYANRSH